MSDQITPPSASDSPTHPNSSPPDMPASSDERNLAMLAHLLGIFTGFIGALIIWLIKKDSSRFVDDQAKEALNFQITILIAYFIAGLTVCLGVGLVLVPVAWIVDIVFCIMGCVAASKGQRYRYPVAIRLLK